MEGEGAVLRKQTNGVRKQCICAKWMHPNSVKYCTYEQLAQQLAPYLQQMNRI